jgi:hypothetical protein
MELADDPCPHLTKTNIETQADLIEAKESENEEQDEEQEKEE